MDPQLKSAITSGAMLIAGMFSGWAASSGLIPADKVPDLTSAVMTIGGVVVAAGIGYLKTRSHTPQALVQAVNSDAVPGVKAVRETSTAPTVIVTATGQVRDAPPAPLPADVKAELK
jgi:hypothetical protein